MAIPRIDPRILHPQPSVFKIHFNNPPSFSVCSLVISGNMTMKNLIELHQFIGDRKNKQWYSVPTTFDCHIKILKGSQTAQLFGPFLTLDSPSLGVLRCCCEM